KLPPSFFPTLPSNIKSYLTQRGIMIPQCWTRKRAHNVIRGQFTAPGCRDWAALCLMNDSIFTLVFPQGDTVKPFKLAKEKVNKWESGFLSGNLSYNCVITVLEKESIRKRYEFTKNNIYGYDDLIVRDDYDLEDISEIDHQGIYDEYIGLAASVHFIRNTRNYIWQIDCSKLGYDETSLKKLVSTIDKVFGPGHNKTLELFVPRMDSLLLPPKFFRHLPPQIASVLDRWKILIPQDSEGGCARNYICGELKQKGQKDWAVLCYKDGLIYITIFWNGSSSDTSLINIKPAESSAYFPSTNKEATFDRSIEITSENEIRELIPQFNQNKNSIGLSPIHQGITDWDSDDAGYVFYYFKGIWLVPAVLGND
ncbi:hypothetical protein LLH00_03220, partial [bacterium]|nr:hypothetical protein [bacterium]